MLKPSLHTHNLGASPGPMTHHQIEKNTLPESHLCKKEKKNEENRGGGVGGVARTVKTRRAIHSLYLQVYRNINTIVLGTKSKHQR